ncbi:glycosyltransferase [Halomonas saccharevitans]|uniref:Glycosyltransferase involved in cell wall bisynthesis n=1 Tax=Halomonas saccharevitans TaxID=416872 RepID=A0A1I7CK95_9GAMM|nr:glycosyltransferase [Halomonas saccharevitans]SFT99833.1 Glycosyltransferase involved in cell wall bisynthesis [Halomonas saccharevitans]
MKRIAFIVSAPTTADDFLHGHIAALSEHYHVDLVANLSDGYKTSLKVEHEIHAPIRRNIHLWHDLVALVTLIMIFADKRYDAVHSITPKAGLLAMIAAGITRVPVRFHTFTGQVWATRSGLSRWLLRLLDQLTHRFSTYSLIDSHSQRSFLIKEKVVKQEKSSVLLNGSISGVDIERFRPDGCKRDFTRAQHGVTPSEFVFLFLGRINAEKGVPELISAFRTVSRICPAAKLMIVGKDESGMFADGSVEMEFAEKLIRVDYTREPEFYFNSADVFCLPSHREGFGSVLIEAAACGLSSIASNIYGISDAVIDSETGLLHAVKSEVDLSEKMLVMIHQSGLRHNMASCAMQRARREFSASALEKSLVDFYGNKLS